MSKIAPANSHAQAHGIVSADHTSFPGGTTNFLREDGTFATPPGSGSSGDSTRALGRARVEASPGASDDEFSDASIDAAWTEVTPATDPGDFKEKYNRMNYHHLAAPGGARRFHALMRSKASGSIAVGDYIESRIEYREHTNFVAAALAFADGTTVGSGEQVLLWIFGGADTQSVSVEVQHVSGYNSETSRGTTASGVITFQPVYFRLKYEASNTWGGYYSYDGFIWTATQTNFATTMTPTKMGFGCYFYDNHAPPAVSVMNWMYFRYNPADE